jgi:hypothetical protein
VWLQETIADLNKASGIAVVQHASQAVAFATLPPSGWSVDLVAGAAVEIHLPPLPPLLEVRPPPEGFSAAAAAAVAAAAGDGSIDSLVGAATAGAATMGAALPSALGASAGTTPPSFVVWRNASFPSLERLARTAALAARHAQRFRRGAGDAGAAAVAAAAAAMAAAQQQQRDNEARTAAENMEADEPAAIVEDGAATEEDGATKEGARAQRRETASASSAGQTATAADEALVLDQMLVHLARPLLCVTPLHRSDGNADRPAFSGDSGGSDSDSLGDTTHHADASPDWLSARGQQGDGRPARVLVLGDSHTHVFAGAASHYHDTPATGSSRGGGGSEGAACALSNYQTCRAPGASAHGLGNPNSKVSERAACMAAAALCVCMASCLPPCPYPPYPHSPVKSLAARRSLKLALRKCKHLQRPLPTSWPLCWER